MLTDANWITKSHLKPRTSTRIYTFLVSMDALLKLAKSQSKAYRAANGRGQNLILRHESDACLAFRLLPPVS